MAVDIISYSLRDDKGSRATVQIHVPAGESLADLTALSNSVAAALDTLTGALLTGAAITQSVSLPGGIKTSPTVDEDIEVGCNFGFNAVGTQYRHTIRVPAFMDAYIIGEEADVTDADVQAFRDAIINGVSPALPSDRYSNDLDALLGTRVTFRK